MAKLQLSFIFGIASLFFTIPAFAQFPYAESFKNSTAPGIVFGGAPAAYLTASREDPEGDGYLRLTKNSVNQKGYIYSDAVLPSTNGLKVEFEYYIYGGNQGADGISFFLFDASVEKFNIGGFGGSLGYAQITTTNPISPGVSKGYLAVGIDEWGNFSNPNEGRQGGIGRKPHSVTIRGKGDGASLTPDNYKYLTSVQTLEKGFSLAGSANGRAPLNSDPNFRKVFIELEPLRTVGYSITVKIQSGNKSPVTVIDKFPYNEQAPPLLRYGIASSTGESTNFHEIRNVSIDISNPPDDLINPTASDDLIVLCPGETGGANILTNDIARTSGSAILPASVDLNPLTSAIETSFTVAGKGTFAVNAEGVVMFTPVDATVQGDVSIEYTVKDVFGSLSNKAKITARLEPSAVVAEAGPDRLISIKADNRVFSLTGNSTASSNGIWTQISGPSSAVFVNPTLGSTQVRNCVQGAYVFRWTLSPGTPCESSDEVMVTVNVIESPEIGLAKDMTNVRKAINGSYDLTYTFTLINYGLVDLQNITLLDDLSSVFNGTQWTVKGIRTSGTLEENSSFDGLSSHNLLNSSSRLAAQDTATVLLDLNVLPQGQQTLFTNSAFTEAYSIIDGEKATDLSTNGLKPDPQIPGDFGPSDPTPVELQVSTVFIPEGFSPNNDGRNDKFVIHNTFNKKIALEVYNRWGNRVYRSANYENNWDGRCNEGIFVGQDVTSGTYYYIVVLDNNEKYSGFITINR